jgi:hypothetical protein
MVVGTIARSGVGARDKLFLLSPRRIFVVYAVSIVTITPLGIPETIFCVRFINSYEIMCMSE